MGAEQGSGFEKAAYTTRNVGLAAALVGAILPGLEFFVPLGLVAGLGGELVGHELKVHRRGR